MSVCSPRFCTVMGSPRKGFARGRVGKGFVALYHSALEDRAALRDRDVMPVVSYVRGGRTIFESCTYIRRKTDGRGGGRRWLLVRGWIRRMCSVSNIARRASSRTTATNLIIISCSKRPNDDNKKNDKLRRGYLAFVSVDTCVSAVVSYQVYIAVNKIQ